MSDALILAATLRYGRLLPRMTRLASTGVVEVVKAWNVKVCGVKACGVKAWNHAYVM